MTHTVHLGWLFAHHCNCAKKPDTRKAPHRPLSIAMTLHTRVMALCIHIYFSEARKGVPTTDAVYKGVFVVVCIETAIVSN